MLTKEGQVYFVGGVAILGLVLVLWLGSLLWWIIGGAALLYGVYQGARLWSRAHTGLTEAQLRTAKVDKARAEAALKREEVEAAKARRHLIPEGYIGAQLVEPIQASLYHVWTFRQERSPALTRIDDYETVVEALPPPALPGPVDLLQVLASFRPSAERILLAVTEQGPLTCSLEGVSHVALAAPTGGGKTNLMRMLLAQILACQAVVWLADPHYTPLDPRSHEDWRMIAARLAEPPYTDPHLIKDVLAGLVAEMQRRYELRRAGQPWGAPCYLAVDEWPAILSGLDRREAEEAAALASTLLRQGRKVDVNVITSSQDFLVESIGGSGEIRANLRTAYFAGGGLATARALLDPKIKLPDAPLGKGVVLLRSEEALPSPSLVRVPYASNEALYRLLPMKPLEQDEQYWANFPPLPPNPKQTHQNIYISPQPAPTASTEPSKANIYRAKVSEEDRAFIMEQHRAGKSATAIAMMMRGTPNFNTIVKQVLAEEEARAAAEESDA